MEKKTTKTEKAVQMYAERMIETIETLKSGWRKTWFTEGAVCTPRSIDGREYNGMNLFLLYITCEAEKWQYPVFVTFNRAKELGAKVIKGEKATPVLSWFLQAFDPETHAPIDMAAYYKMSDEEKNKYRIQPYLRAYDVFNIEQTTLKDDNPQMWAKVTKGMTLKKTQSADGMYICKALDDMIARQSWVCPISIQKQDKAYYRPSTDEIVLPTKAQFDIDGCDHYAAGQEYYSTMLHEMAHSTGVEKRLNRPMKDNYGREELVAELTAAVCGKALGFAASVQENNAAYLKEWIKQIKEQPRFLVSVLNDVSKAFAMIREHVKSIKVKNIAA